jgi:hydrogenase maturation protein HypF
MVNILDEVTQLIGSGGILALKGTGGYHFLCNALDNKAVSDLRIRKGREMKPFAVMFRDLKAVKSYCEVNELEEEIITSWRSPVVLLTQKNPLAETVSSGLGTIGAILPYMPVHHLIFRHLDNEALVFTSGNLADEPVVTEDEDARLRLHPVTPYILSFNREIVNRADDSVVKVAAGKVSLIRRSKGYVPEPVELDVSAKGILAFGAEQKNCFCIGKDRQALMGQHIGDLKGSETFEFYAGAMEKFIRLFRFNPRLLVCDRHPAYLSTQFAALWSEEKKLPLISVQHHHAHVTACMAEHHLTGEVTGISLDGTGFGDDGHIWGGEFLIASRNSFRRYAHFDYIPMPGGDKAVKEPWRMAFSYLNHYPQTRNWIEKIPALRDLGEFRLGILREMVEKQVNSPWSSGAGRLFDAVAVILGLCHNAGFDAEPPMRLESIIDGNTNDNYPYDLAPVISFGCTDPGPGFGHRPGHHFRPVPQHGSLHHHRNG